MTLKPPQLSRLPKTKHPLQRYLDQYAHQMERKMSPQWKPEADQISRLLTDSGLLRSSPQADSPSQFLADAVSENPAMWDNSQARSLMKQAYNPEQAQSALELATLLISPPGSE